jgi:hypothetical protein
MKSLFEKDSVREIYNRINNLSAQSKREWGKMDVAQMLAHCSKIMELATGQKKLPRLFIGRILGPMAKASYLSEKPFSKNGPTDRNFIITNQRDFNPEKEKLINLIQLFSNGGETKCTTHPHSFFGRLTPAQWGTSMYKHLDHHLKQFGV